MEREKVYNLMDKLHAIADEFEKLKYYPGTIDKIMEAAFLAEDEIESSERIQYLDSRNEYLADVSFEDVYGDDFFEGFEGY